MRKIIDGKLTFSHNIDELEAAIKSTKDIRMYKRYTAVLLHYEGHLNIKIAEMLSLEQHAVSRYIKKYKNGGLASLEMKHSTGAPRKLTDEQEKLLVKTITENTPDEVGFECKKNWTIAIIIQWVNQNFNVTMSLSGMSDLLHRLNLSYTRPTYVMKKADREKQEEFKNKFEELKKTP